MILWDFELITSKKYYGILDYLEIKKEDIQFWISKIEWTYYGLLCKFENEEVYGILDYFGKKHYAKLLDYFGSKTYYVNYDELFVILAFRE